MDPESLARKGNVLSCFPTVPELQLWAADVPGFYVGDISGRVQIAAVLSVRSLFVQQIGGFSRRSLGVLLGVRCCTEPPERAQICAGSLTSSRSQGLNVGSSGGLLFPL